MNAHGCALQDGVKHPAVERWSFVAADGVEMPLEEGTSAFITMNPGYIGRAELPESLKVRPGHAEREGLSGHGHWEEAAGGGGGSIPSRRHHCQHRHHPHRHRPVLALGWDLAAPRRAC